MTVAIAIFYAFGAGVFFGGSVVGDYDVPSAIGRAALWPVVLFLAILDGDY